ncbi:DUF3857 and transglutaminase domain-containing protein [Terriglobus sp. TAA 43]|uniref:DUF3857 domain-containing transglutaminase family protein n=1 Tax=Terriglobus sp. TAA 43 TaxID=278961 RepID=UPI000689A10C|nr:DUF3857 and transglutaminase domain-containing protein [Terriglobus sp. TAA 43]
MPPVALPGSLLRAVAASWLMAACCIPAFAKDQVPDWVKTAAQTSTDKVSREADAAVLLEEVAYTVAPNGSLVEHVRRVVKILRPQGRKQTEMFAYYRSSRDKLNYLHIWSIGPDGKEYAPKDKEQSDLATDGGFALYSDFRVRGLTPPAMDVGGIAAMEYERQEQPYENDIIWRPGEDIPILRERLTLNLPDGYTYKATWKGKPKAQPVDAEHGKTLWEVENQESLVTHDRVPLSPNQFAIAPRMDIFYQGPVTTPYGAMTGDWKSIGEWYERLAKDRNKPDPAITAKAQELVAGKTDFRDRVAAVSNFVQSDIRYVAIEIGVGGNQPHPAADIFRARYGDCKDKATLLSAMLDAVGVRSTWVMVDTHRGMISSDAPSLMGNHMIAAIELPANYMPKEMYSVVIAKSGKRFLIFDPTWEKTPFGQLEHELQGSDALLVDGADSQAIRLPILKPEQNHVQRKASFQLAADGTLSGTVTQEEGGDIARTLRALSLNDEKTQQQALDRSLARDLRAFHVEGMKMENTAALDRNLQLQYTIKADHFAEPVGNLFAIRPRVLGTESMRVDEKPRILPIDLGETRLIHDDFTIELPAGFSVDELPPPVHIDLGFASYTSESKVVDHAIHYSRTYTVREVSLPAERYADVQKLARIIQADEQSSAVLKRAN